MANKNESTMLRRAKYIQERIENVKNKRSEIKRIAKELFLSERTIYLDLEKKLPKDSY